MCLSSIQGKHQNQLFQPFNHNSNRMHQMHQPSNVGCQHNNNYAYDEGSMMDSYFYDNNKGDDYVPCHVDVPC